MSVNSVARSTFDISSDAADRRAEGAGAGAADDLVAARAGGAPAVGVHALEAGLVGELRELQVAAIAWPRAGRRPAGTKLTAPSARDGDVGAAGRDLHERVRAAGSGAVRPTT